MSGLIRAIAGRPKSTQIAGFQVQTSVYGVPIPIVYGKNRVAGNLIHMPKTPVLKDSHQNKASRASKGAAGGEMYTAPLVLALCEGPITGIGNVWRDKDTLVDFTAVYAAAGWTLKLGSIAQAAWSYLTTNYPSQAVPYQFTAYVANDNAELPSDSLSQYSWEIQGFLPFEGFGGGQIADALPSAVLNDFLTATNYGVGWSSSQIDSTWLATFADYCAAAGIFFSPVIDEQKPASDWINEFCEIGNTGLVWSDGKLRTVPFGDIPLTGHGHTYMPNTTPQYDLTDSHFLPRGGDLDPIQVVRADPTTAINQVTVEYRDRDHDYNIATQTAQDLYAIQQYGTIPLTLTLHSITTAAVARQVAQIRLQREQNVRNKYLFRLGWRFSRLDPMDLVTITDAGLGLSLTPVRITEILEGTDEQGFDVTAEEWPFGTASATAYTVPNPTGTLPNANVAPGNTATPIITETPDQIKTEPFELMIAASGGANWGGCDVWLSADNSNFQKVGRIIGAAAMGTLTANLNTTGTLWPSVDNVNTLSVDISASGRTLSSYSATDFAKLVPLCYVDGEWVAFQNAALTSPGHYNLTSLYRSIYNTSAPTHLSGTKFFLVDNAVGRFPFPLAKAGQTVWVKLPAFNIYGAALQDVASVSSFSYVIQNDPTQLGNAQPQGTVSIDANGVWSASADGPSTAKSYRYATSTSAFPNDTTTASGGTLVNGRTFSIAAGGTLSFGQTIFITIIPFTATGGNGSQLPSIHLRGSYQTFNSTKTVAFSRASFVQTYKSSGAAPNMTFDVNASPTNPALDGNTIPIQILAMTMMIELPAGITLQSAQFDGSWNAAATPLGAFNAAVYKANSLVNSGNYSYAFGSQTISVSLSGTVVSTNQSLLLRQQWTGGLTGPADAGQATIGDAYVTYSMPTPDKTV